MRKLVLLFSFACLCLLQPKVLSQTIVDAPYYKMVSWDSSPYKSYKVTGGIANPYYDMTFRLLSPKNYDESILTTSTYPLIVMLHGAGESALGNPQFGEYPEEDPRRFNNDNHLYHLGSQYLKAVNDGKWPGFVLFPQNPNGFWTGQNWFLEEVIEIIQAISQQYKIDPNRIYLSGLSAGAHGVWDGIARFTNVFAAALPFSGIGLPNDDNTTKVAHVPVWYFQGEIDTSPSLWTADQTIQAMKNAGATPVYTVYPQTAHNTWNKAIAEKDFFPYMLRHSKLSIHAYFGKTEFSPGEAVNVKLGISPGFSGYEWRKDDALIPEATTNEITTNSLGSYTVRFRRGSAWTEWSNPVVLRLKNPPSIVTQPANIAKTPGSTATFSVTASGSNPLSYQWVKDGVNIEGATSSSYTIPAVVSSDAGFYKVIVSNSEGSATSNEAKLTVTAEPIANIDAPLAGTYYRGGETISYFGSATDGNGNSLEASAFSWKLEFHKPNGIYIAWTRTGSKTGSFSIPTSGETSVDVFYRLTLTVTDPNGLKKTTYRDVPPYTSNLTLATQPSGLQVNLDNVPRTTPYTIKAVEGRTRSLGIASPQTLNGKTYTFSHWLHGGTASQTIAIPAEDRTYTAVFVSPGEESSVEILTPAAGTHYKGGETISYSGSGTDSNGNPLAASSFAWKLEFHKPNGIFTAWTRTGSKTGVFSIPTSGETAVNVFYRLTLTVTDPNGVKKTVFRDISPYTTGITLATQPAGLQVNLDNIPKVTPYLFQAVEGRTRSMSAPSPQTLNGKTYTFSHWLHGGGATQTVSIPAEDITYTAVFTSSAEGPSSEITTPIQGTHYRGGETISYSGSGKNSNGTELPTSSFTWNLEFHKIGKIVYLWTRTGSKTGSFSIPTGGETSSDVFYRLILTVTDANGVKKTMFRDVPPYTSKVTLATQPTGLQMILDNKTVTAPYLFTGVVGRNRTHGVVNSQTSGGKTYKFSYWTHGGSANQTITIPENDVTYTAVFVLDNSTSARITSENFETKEEAVTIYPNPSSGYLTVKVKADKGEKVTFSFINSIGKVTKQETLTAEKEGTNSFRIDLSSLNKNSYTLKVESNSAVNYRHLVIN